MQKPDPGTDYTVAATSLLEGLERLIADAIGPEAGVQSLSAEDDEEAAEVAADVEAAGRLEVLTARRDTEEEDEEAGEFLVNNQPKALLQLACELLRVAGGRTEDVKQCMLTLLHELRDLREYANGSPLERETLYISKQEEESEEERYEQSKQHLDKAAALLGLPRGYFYQHIEESRESRSLTNKVGRREIVACQNFAHTDDSQWVGTSDVPRFVGESAEFYYMRLPPKERGTAWYERKQQELLASYGGRGGGPTEALSERRFRAAASVLVGAFVPSDAKDRYQLIADLLKLCGVKRSGKEVRDIIVERTRRSDGPILGSDPCVAALKSHI